MGSGWWHHSQRLILGVSISGISSNSNLSRSSTKFVFLLFGVGALFAGANEASMYYKLRSVKRINKIYKKPM